MQHVEQPGLPVSAASAHLTAHGLCRGCRSGHQSFSSNKALNDLVGNIAHSSILVPYHGWRVSHREHHSNHGHVENDESWHPVTKSLYDGLVSAAPLPHWHHGGDEPQAAMTGQGWFD